MRGVTARGVAGGAVLIGAITVLARIAGFAKQYAFAQTVGTNCLSVGYMTANQIPNIVFEVVVGGALAGMVVPVLAGAAAASAGVKRGRAGAGRRANNLPGDLPGVEGRVGDLPGVGGRVGDLPGASAGMADGAGLRESVAGGAGGAGGAGPHGEADVAGSRESVAGGAGGAGGAGLHGEADVAGLRESVAGGAGGAGGAGLHGEADGAAARERAGWISSALLTWVVVVLVPLGVLTALFAGPIIGLFFGESIKGCGTVMADVTAVATRMLVVFAPQIPLYGVAVVLYGVLQSHKRFAGPAVAPLVSSIVVIVAYLLFVPLSGGSSDPQPTLGPAELALSVGTSLGVLSLVLAVLGPTARLGLRWRPTLRFPDGVAGQVRRLAAAGVAALLAQQAAMVVVVLLSNKAIGNGAITVYNYAWAIYLVPYAVLAVPIATSAFPRLSAQAGDPVAFSALAARTTRAVVLVSGLAAGVLAAASGPVAVVFLGAKSDVPSPQLAVAIALFAPGLVGYGLIAHLSRVLYAAGHGRAAATGTVVGWLVVMVAQAVFVVVLPEGWKIGGMALGMSVGMSVGGAMLLGSVVRVRGSAAVAGLLRALGAAVAGGALAYLAGAGVVRWLGVSGTWPSVGAAVLAAVLALAVGAVAVAAVDRADAGAVAGVLKRGGGG